MKRFLSLILTFVLVAGCVFMVTGCGSKKEKKDETTVISYTHGKGIFKVSVPKDKEGNAKYLFTPEKPKQISTSASFYLVTNKAVFGFSTQGLSYNTSKEYKEKYGDIKASFEGYLEFIEDKDLYNKSYLPGLEQFEINGRKALRYHNREGGAGKYKYYGYFYMIGVDDIYPGSRVSMVVNYKTEDKPLEIKELDDETLKIINSLKIEVVE